MRRRVTAIVATCVLLLAGCGSDDGDKTQSGEQASHPASIAKLRFSGGAYGYPSPFAYVRGAGLIMCSYVFDTLLW